MSAYQRDKSRDINTGNDPAAAKAMLLANGLTEKQMLV
jgi:hypothetical protein